MKVGMVGLGKMGTPIALAMEQRGHEVIGFDLNPARMTRDEFPFREVGPDGVSPINPILSASSLRFGSLDQVIAHAEIVFCAVQTPHLERYEGITPMPYERADFDYTHLTQAVASIADSARRLNKRTILVVQSTVLPGSVRRHLLPVINDYILLCYNPSFIAMGTTMRDYLNPEFVLFGVWNEEAAAVAERFYRTIHDRPFFKTTIENAELIKVAYNTFIGLKIVFANTLMEICHKMENTDVDQVTDALKMASDRLISPRYLTAGMGDGGGCHPRDNIALSWLAKRLDLSYDLFEMTMKAREQQANWLVNLMVEHRLPKVILGKAFKPETNLTLGSPALLCQLLLEAKGHDVTAYDPYIDPAPPAFPPSVFLVATRHEQFRRFPFPPGSVVIDPWRFVETGPGVTLIPVGIGPVVAEGQP